jgi:hypothetical protein
MPPGPALIRYADRLFWLTGLSLTILAAFAIDALTDSDRVSQRAWIFLGVVAIIATAIYGFAPGGLHRAEAVALVVLMVACAAASMPRWRTAAAWVVVAAVALNVVAVPVHHAGHLLDSVDAYRRFEPSLTELRAWETSQDRTSFYPSIHSTLSLNLMHKTASLIRVKEPYDYDALIVQRQVRYNTMLNLGEVPENAAAAPPQSARPRIRQRLLSVAAVRYVVAVKSSRKTLKGMWLRPLPLTDTHIEFYANDGALNRARFVPRIEVMPEPDALLHRLAYGTEDLTTVAYVDAPVPSGFEGKPGSIAGGHAEFVLDDPEHLIIEVDAPARGFLVLADQYYPGWHATVNDAPAAIVQANYTFRLVEVPAGLSRVEFRYRPRSVAMGAATSCAALTLAGAVLWRERRR